MKTETCVYCGKSFGASLDDSAFGGDALNLCDPCKAELAVDGVCNENMAALAAA